MGRGKQPIAAVAQGQKAKRGQDFGPAEFKEIMLEKINELIIKDDGYTMSSWDEDHEPTKKDFFVAQSSTGHLETDFVSVSYAAFPTMEEALAHLEKVVNDSSDLQPVGVINLGEEPTKAFTTLRLVPEPAETDSFWMHN